MHPTAQLGRAFQVNLSFQVSSPSLFHCQSVTKGHEKAWWYSEGYKGASLGGSLVNLALWLTSYLLYYFPKNLITFNEIWHMIKSIKIYFDSFCSSTTLKQNGDHKRLPKRHILASRPDREEGRRQATASLQMGCPAARLAIRPGGTSDPAQASLFPTLSVGSIVNSHY